MTTLRAELERVGEALAAYRKHERNEDGCSDHPDAPHGFDRDQSHSEDRYVCECSYWQPDPAENQSIAQQTTHWLEQHHAALLAAVEDGERYRYLRDEYDGAVVEKQNAWCSAYDTLGGPYVAEYIDAAIDRARGALKNGEE